MVYTGTHDNDTARGWYNRVSEQEKSVYRDYLDRDGSNVSWDFIRGVWSSVAIFGLAPMQDFLDLGNEARMNYPGNPSGNWMWRMSADAQNPELQAKIKQLNYLYSRMNDRSRKYSLISHLGTTIKYGSTEISSSLRRLHPNIWFLTIGSFLTDVSSEMLNNLIPLFLYNVLGVQTSIIGLIDGIAEATASLVKLLSGTLSDRIGKRKWLTVLGYAISTIFQAFPVLRHHLGMGVGSQVC